MPMSISLENPQLISLSKRLEKNSAGVPVKFITEYTIKGKFLANGINGGLTLSVIQANLSSILPSLSVLGGGWPATKLVSFSVDKSNSQDTIEKDYILVFEHHAALPSSAYGDLNLTPLDLFNVSDLKVEESEEKTVTTVTKTLSVSITYPDVNYASSFGSAKSLAEKINSGITASGDRVTLSVISDENSKTYSFVFNNIKFAAGGKELTTSITRNISIGSNGAIIATETKKEYAVSRDGNPDFSNLEYSEEPSENQLKNFIQTHIAKGGGGAANYRNTFFKTNYRKSIDYILGLKTCTITITNSPEYIANEGIITLVEIKTKIQYPESAEKRIIRGSIIGFGKKGTTPKNNPKFQSAKTQFSKIVGQDFAKAIKKEQINKGTYITNASINGDITEGSINFDITYEKRPEFNVKNSSILYGSAGIYANSEMHLGNVFLVVGSKDSSGKEIIQQSNQSKPAEYSLKLEALSKSINFRPCVDLFKKLIQDNVNGIIKSINITTSTRSKSFQGTASWKEYGRYREKNDLSQKSQAKTIDI